MSRKTECVRFLTPAEIAGSQICKLHNVLQPFGFDVTLSDADAEFSAMVCLEIQWNDDRLRKLRARNAGRPCVPSSVTWEAIDQWRTQGLAASAIAKKLHVSRATYYNHLKSRDKYPDYPCF